MTALPANTSHQFAALNGAIVVILHVEPHRPGSTLNRKWQCLGCDDGSPDADHMPTVRKAANQHASTCRALPQD